MKCLNEGVLGEFVVDSDIVSSYVKIYNKSEYDITDINVKFIDTFESNAKMTYEKNELEEDLYPGQSGDCARSLLLVERVTFTLNLILIEEGLLNSI